MQGENPLPFRRRAKAATSRAPCVAIEKFHGDSPLIRSRELESTPLLLTLYDRWDGKDFETQATTVGDAKDVHRVK